MRLSLLAASLLVPLAATSQQIRVAPFVKATDMSADNPDHAAILAPVEAVFAAIAAGDGAAALVHVHGTGGITVSNHKPDGTRSLHQLSWADWAAAFKPSPMPLEERFVGTPKVEIDGDIGMVWGEYIFLIDGKLSHCGIDHFSMVRVDGQWKIASLAWTQRKTGCPTQ